MIIKVGDTARCARSASEKEIEKKERSSERLAKMGKKGVVQNQKKKIDKNDMFRDSDDDYDDMGDLDPDFDPYIRLFKKLQNKMTEVDFELVNLFTDLFDDQMQHVEDLGEEEKKGALKMAGKGKGVFRKDGKTEM